jgi:putative Holliday junction resolvase
LARVLALDYGTKRTGVAVTDSLQIIANPCETIETVALTSFLKSYLNENEVETIVIGQAFHSDGTAMPFKEEIDNLIRFINKNYPEIKVARQDESFTSYEAKEVLLKSGISRKKRREKGNIDKVSAVLILQRFLGHV